VIVCADYSSGNGYPSPLNQVLIAIISLGARLKHPHSRSSTWLLGAIYGVRRSGYPAPWLDSSLHMSYALQAYARVIHAWIKGP
jgi:hypothetical protein